MNFKCEACGKGWNTDELRKLEWPTGNIDCCRMQRLDVDLHLLYKELMRED